MDATTPPVMSMRMGPHDSNGSCPQGIIVCYYTSGPYEKEAARLERSLIRLGLPRFFELQSNKKDWLDGVHLRPKFLQACRSTFPDQIILSLDADCFVHENPWPWMPKGDWDIACHHFLRSGNRSEQLPGTLFLRPTPAVDTFLKVWEEQNKVDRATTDRVNFSRSIGLMRKSLKVGNLMPELCWIFDLSKMEYGKRQPIIEHLQASRSFRRSQPIPSASRRESRIQEIDRRGYDNS